MQVLKKLIPAFLVSLALSSAGWANEHRRHPGAAYLPQAFIYGYVDNLVIADIENANQNEVAYCSFEASTTGNWTFAAVGAYSIPGERAFTGNNFFDLNNGAVTKSFSPAPGKNMIVSYWSRSGVCTVNGSTTAQAGRTVVIDGNFWTYYEHLLVNPASVSISKPNGVIDELRLYPADALMKSFTYEPLVGVTTECDANNIVTYYEYDIFKRLTVVRDHDYKVIKRTCYANAGQQEDCSGQVFKSVVKSATFTRSLCAPGYQGATVTYTVPAGTYVSSVDQQTADQMAQADVDANASIYANINGACNFIYQSTDQSNYFYSNVCPPGHTAFPIYVSIPAGMFTSTTSQFDANMQALTYGQNYANQNGACTGPPEEIYADNSSGTNYYVIFTNISTNEQLFLEMYAYTTGGIGSVPGGVYNIEITPFSTGNFQTFDMCNTQVSGYTANFYSMATANCNTIVVF